MHSFACTYVDMRQAVRVWAGRVLFSKESYTYIKEHTEVVDIIYPCERLSGQTPVFMYLQVCN